MPLDEETKNQFLAKLKEKEVKGNCPMCGHNDWIMADELLGIPLTTPTGGISLGPIIPAASLICANCGNIQSFSAVMLGLMKKKEEAKSP